LSEKRRAAGAQRPVVRSRCGPHHLAFFRGVVLDGLDPLALAKRYLPVRPLPKVVEAHRRWIRDELVTTARRLELFHIARLLQRTVPPAPPSSGPTLEAFAAQYPDGFYSESELVALFQDAYPEPPAMRTARRRRTWAVKRLRQAIDLLEQASVFAPQPSDPVQAWLADGLAKPLRAAGITTLSELASLVDERGARWYTQVPKLGPQKAAAVGLWLRANVAGFEQRVGERAVIPYRELRPQLAARRPAETGVVPFEYFRPTEATDGRNSPLRCPPQAGGLPAVDDRDALTRWLQTHLTVAEIRDPLSWEKNATYRSYRREMERLWAWAVVERGKALSALSDTDVTAYMTFLYDPQPRDRWVGPRRPRWHPDWRPFCPPRLPRAAGAADGALPNYRPPSPRTIEHILTVVDALFEWWLRQGYIVRNPWRAGPKRDRSKHPQFASRSLSLPAWNAVRDMVAALPPGEQKARLRALFSFLYGSGVRRAELAAATMETLRSSTDVNGETSWELTVLGKGKVPRKVPVALPAIEALRDYFELRFEERRLPVGKAVSLFATLPLPKRPRAPLSAWGINSAVCDAFLSAAREIELSLPEAADELRNASAHWLRHSFATHAVKYDDVRLEVLQKVLGHKAITTTANNYVDEDSEMRREVSRAVAERARL